MAYRWFKLFVQILIILGPLIVLAKTIHVYDKHEVPKEVEMPDDVICLDPARPYVILSRRDKARLEHIINAHGTKSHDPNLDVP